MSHFRFVSREIDRGVGPHPHSGPRGGRRVPGRQEVGNEVEIARLELQAAVGEQQVQLLPRAHDDAVPLPPTHRALREVGRVDVDHGQAHLNASVPGRGALGQDAGDHDVRQVLAQLLPAQLNPERLVLLSAQRHVPQPQQQRLVPDHQTDGVRTDAQQLDDVRVRRLVQRDPVDGEDAVPHLDVRVPTHTHSFRLSAQRRGEPSLTHLCAAPKGWISVM